MPVDFKSHVGKRVLLDLDSFLFGSAGRFPSTPVEVMLLMNSRNHPSNDGCCFVTPCTTAPIDVRRGELVDGCSPLK